MCRDFDLDAAGLAQTIMGAGETAGFFPAGTRQHKRHFDHARVDLGLDGFNQVARHCGAARGAPLKRR
eukprot:2032565-Pyramimonas_sp.AAC.1